MPTVVLATLKGGAGKSTIAINLAVCAVLDGHRVAIIDHDPQRTATMWWKARGKPGNPWLHEGAGDPVEDVEHLKRDGYAWIFVDTGRLDIEHVERACEAADIVLIPSRVSGFDIVPTRDVVALARKHKRPFAFVFNQTDPKWRAGLQNIIKQLKPIGYVIPKTIRHLTVHEKATFAGKIGSEMKDATAKTAKGDFAAVWKAVKTLARTK